MPPPPSESLPQGSEHGCLSYPVFLFPLSSLWRQKELQEQGEIRVIQLGFDLDAHGIVFTEDYRTRVCEREGGSGVGVGWGGHECGVGRELGCRNN